MLLYIVSTIFICYLNFNLRQNVLTPVVWNTLFWIILMFTAVNTIGKSFAQERQGRLLYFYTVTSPVEIILSKIIYNTFLMLILSLTGFVFYIYVMGNPIGNVALFTAAIVLGSMGFASTLTIVSAIAAKADGNAALMAILSFPLIIPMLLVVVKLAKNAMDDLDVSVSMDEIWVLLSIDAIVMALSLVLFPYIWRS